MMHHKAIRDFMVFIGNYWISVNSFFLAVWENDCEYKPVCKLISLHESVFNQCKYLFQNIPIEYTANCA